jgi:hypothetical protein
VYRQVQHNNVLTTGQILYQQRIMVLLMQPVQTPTWVPDLLQGQYPVQVVKLSTKHLSVQKLMV